VEELLQRLNLTWREADFISKPLDAGTYDGMELTVGRIIRENQTYTTVLPHETIHCSDASLPEGTVRIMTEGEDGQVLCEATVTYLNGVETQRSVLNRQVVSQPVSEVVAIGTGTQETETEEPRPVIDQNTITLPTGEVLTYTAKVTCLATAYHCEGYVGTTATGTRARVGAIAVDPEVFPYGTRFYIMTKDGEYLYGVATAEDCGDKRFIYDTRLDLFFNTKKECVQFGARSCDVYILG
jgi:3D (Asp-Asp-Asp) domain-containing protein